MQAYLFYLPQQGNDLHMTLLKAFERNGILDFSPDNPKRKSLVFHTNGKIIHARTNAKLDNPNIGMSTEKLDVENGSVIIGKVTLSRDRSMMISPEKREAFIREHNRLPKSSENHVTRRMTDEQVNEYIPNLFAKAGMSIIEFKISESPLRFHALSSHKKKLKTMDISFTATITDIEAFEHAWFNGIGQKKTYGFGMIRAGLK